MDAVVSYFSAHPMVLAIGIFLIVIFVLNFIFKSLFKLILVVLAILIATIGYYYITDPQKIPQPIQGVAEAVKSGVDDFVDKSKSFYEDSKNLYKKGKEAPGDVNKLLKKSEEEVGKK
ncbi:MAG TPA: hypothetical protein P5040_06495 [Smithella sp.]|mgnify:CR=1 FL=1|nr:hypothetical protein [Smithella sp.]HRS97817.1 hypothetical protein [Smithella sp.]